MPGPRHGRGGGLAAGQHQDRDLVGQLGGGQAPALLVAGREQPGHQVVAVLRSGPGLMVAVDQLADLTVPAGHGPVVTPVGGSGQPARQLERRPRVDAAQEDVEGLAEAFGLFGAELRGKQGAQGDRGGEREHLLYQVDHAAVGPARHGGRDLLPHHGHVAA